MEFTPSRAQECGFHHYRRQPNFKKVRYRRVAVGDVPSPPAQEPRHCSTVSCRRSMRFTSGSRARRSRRPEADRRVGCVPARPNSPGSHHPRTRHVAISQIASFAHLSESDVEALGVELDAIRRSVEASLGANDAAYIHRTIMFQRVLDVAARLVIHRSKTVLGWTVGTAALAVAKCVENMEIGHNVTHGQWDWMNDPEIHSNTWEWDMTAVSSQWRYSHNYSHHVF